jgi:hypothetical protein
MTCKAGHILNYDGYCRICGQWLVDVDGPLSPFPREEEPDDHPRPDTEP